MSAGTETFRQPGKTPRQLSALTMSALVALSNNDHELNGAPITNGGGLGSAVNQVTWTTGTIVSKASGKFLVCATMYAQASAIDDPVEYQLIRDAGSVLHTESIIGPLAIQDAGHVGEDASVALTWIDSVTPGSSHTYAIRASNMTGGHTVSVPLAGGASVTLVELPG